MKKNKPFLLDPNNIPEAEYYLEPLGNSYPRRPNSSKELTVEGFCNAANALIEPFGKALTKARESQRAKS